MKQEQGQVIVVALIVVGFVLVNTLLVIAGSTLYFNNSIHSVELAQVTNLAEAGVDKAIASLNASAGAYNGEAEVTFGPGTFSIVVTSPNASSRLIEATGYIPNKIKPRVRKTVKIQASKGVGIAFKYGVQVGEGGLAMGGSNQINGSIYSNGNITGVNQNQITGDAWVAGGTAPNADVSVDCVDPSCTDYLFGKSVSGENRLDVAQSFQLTQSSGTAIVNKVAIKIKKFGTPPDITVRILESKNGDPDKNSVLATGILYANLVTSAYSFTDVTFADSPTLSANTTYWLMLDSSSNSSNYWFWQEDLAQSYAPGLPKWTDDWRSGNAEWTAINGDLAFQTYIGGVVTYFDGGHNSTVEGDVHANTIKNITINKGAYYQAIQDVTAATYYPNTSDPPPKTFPISDANINEWKAQAESADIYEGDIAECVTTLGPGKYIGDVNFDNHCNVTIFSPIYITGTLTLNNTNHLTLDSSFRDGSGVIIVDGVVNISNGNQIAGSGYSSNSILMILSNYDSRTNGISAINVSNTGNTAFLYANKGIIEPGNSNTYKELTAWGIKLFNTSTINYEQGLANAFFTSGPSGSYSIVKGTYQLK